MKLQDGIAGSTFVITLLAALLSPLARESFGQCARNESQRNDVRVKNLENSSQPLDALNRKGLAPLRRALKQHEHRQPASEDQLFQ